MKHAEHDMQAALFQRAALGMAEYPELEWLHAIPNGGARHPITGRRMKAEGVKKGIPDVCLPVPRDPYHGLYIELKVRGRPTSKYQIECIRFLQSQGYCVQVFYDWEQAWDFIAKYLNWEVSSG